MKLSEAIRLGGMVGPQIRGELVTEHGTCAMGGAFDVVGLLNYYLHEVDEDDDIAIGLVWITAFPLTAVLLGYRHECPECGITATLRSTIAHLNDDHQWSREQIADFVGELEELVLQKQNYLNSKILLAPTPKLK